MPARTAITLRDATVEDAAALIALWRSSTRTDPDNSHDAPHVGALWREPSVAEASAAIELNSASPQRRIIVALVGGEIVGTATWDIATTSPINLTRVLLVTDMHVAPTHRRKSVASSMLSAASTYGEEFNCEVVASAAAAYDREPNRFLTKLGFCQVSTIRVVQASMLRSRLTSKATKSRDTGKLIAVRRTLRRREHESRLRRDARVTDTSADA